MMVTYPIHSVLTFLISDITLSYLPKACPSVYDSDWLSRGLARVVMAFLDIHINDCMNSNELIWHMLDAILKCIW